MTAIQKKAQIDRLIDRLTALRVQYANAEPASPDWGHVGYLSATASDLTECARFIESEYARLSDKGPSHARP